MSSVKCPILKGQKRVFFHRFLTLFSSLNHYMLWSKSIIPCHNHNTSSELLLQRGSRGQNECHLSVSVLGNISTAFLGLSVDGNISTLARIVYEKGTLTMSALNHKH